MPKSGLIKFVPLSSVNLDLRTIGTKKKKPTGTTTTVVQQVSGGRVDVGRTPLGDFPPEYDPDEVQNVVRQAFDYQDRRFAQSQGQTEQPFEADEDATPQEQEQDVQEFLAAPQPEESIAVTAGPSTDIDRFTSTTISTTTYDGPGRVMDVSSVDVPQEFQGRGMVRYRIPLKDGMKFGVLSCRWMESVFPGVSRPSTPRWECVYGVILRGIPNLLPHRPQGIFRVIYNGFAPGALTAINNSGTDAYISNTRTLFESVATDEFSTNPPTLYAEMKDTNVVASGALMWPTTNSPDYVTSLREPVVSLVRGTNAREVYGELNSAVSYRYAYLGGQAMGEAQGVAVGASEPPFPANVAIRASSTQVTARTSSTLTGSDGVVEGLPMLYKDCGALALTDDQFSLVLRLSPVRVLRPDQTRALMTSPDNSMRAATWHTSGVKISTANNRETTIDVIVF